MLNYTSEERLALLLSVLGDEVAQAALGGVEPGRAAVLRKLLKDYQSDPPSHDEVEHIVGDFLRYFNFAMETLAPQLKTFQDKSITKEPQSPPKKQEKPVFFPKVDRSNNPVADLNRLDPYQITVALAEDHPKTIALVLQKLGTQHAAAVMEQLTSEVRLATLEYLTEEITVPEPIVKQVLITTVDKAVSVEFRPVEVNQAEVLAEMLRSVSKSLRVELMNELVNTNPELAERVKAKLYLFTDILRIEDRDLQKLLAQVETDYLIVALQRCDQELIDKLLNNLSKRAREMIQEEMEYKQGVSDEEIEAAQQSVVQVIAQLDESGEIKL